MIRSTYNKAKFTKNSYLSKLELINKFNLCHVKTVPSVSRIVIEFPISDFLTSFYSASKKDKYSLDVQIKSVLVVYLLVFNLPSINYQIVQKQKKSSFRRSEDTRNFLLKITLTRKDIIEKFLIKILNDNDMRFISDLHKVFSSVRSKENNNHLYKGRVYLRNILEINTFLSRILHDIDSLDLFFNLILKISNPLSLRIKYLSLYS